MNHTVDALKQKLYDRDYKLTPQRRIILELFVQHPDKHLSAEDVYGMLKQSYPEIGLATVYRTLDLFAELEVLQKMDFGDGKARYESNHNEVHHHHHLICLKCGSVNECEDDLLDDLEASIQKNNNFVIVDHQLKFYGYCKNCRQGFNP